MSAGDYKVLGLVRISASMRRFKELGEIFEGHRRTGLSDNDAAAKTLQTLTEDEGRMLRRMAPPGWCEPPEIAFTKVTLPYGWLGNMSPHAILYMDKVYKTAEALFQGLRFDDETIRELIRAERSPMRAKLVARGNVDRMVVEPRSPKDLGNMRLVLRMKVIQHPDLQQQLVETGKARIIEDCTARPQGVFWGMMRTSDGWKGENWLGRLWMELREEVVGS